MPAPASDAHAPASCGCGERLVHTDVLAPVAAAWQSQIAREVLAHSDDVPRDERIQQLERELSLDPPSPSWVEGAADYAMLGLAAVVATGSMLLVVLRSSLATDVGLAVASGLLLTTGHGLLRSRRQRRAAAHEAQRALRQAEVSRLLAEGEARRQRLDTFSRLAAEIAHEVRNPLGSILLNTELLEEELHACIHASPEVKRLARAVGAEAERLSQLTNEYLTFARLPHLAGTPQPIGAILDEVACFTRGEAARARVDVSVHAEAEACAVVDPKLVRQLLLNLIRNAVDAMPSGGRIGLRAVRHGDRVLVDVSDTGPGVPLSLRESIFDPFFSTKPQGTGLGLAVARRVARDHGGDLTLLPSEPGAHFRLDLPAGACRPAGASAAPAAASLA
jgi:signal transduction histidine kinase